MKTTLLLAVSAFVAGSITGVLWQEQRQPEARPAPVPSAPGNPIAPTGGDGPEDSPVSGRSVPPDSPRAAATVAELRARIPAVLALESPDGILSLVRELESRGEEAFPVLAELLEAILDQKTCRATGLESLQREAIFSSARIRPFAAWGVSREDIAPELRERLAGCVLSACPPEQLNAVALSLLALESDDDVCLAIVDRLGGSAPEETPALLAAFQSHIHQPWVAAGVLRALAMNPTPEVIRFLQGQESTADAEIARQARMSLREANPPVAGILIRDVTGDGDSGLREGDIVTRWNGTEVRTLKQWSDLRRTGVRGTSVVVEVERNGVVQEVTLEEFPAAMGAKPVDPARSPR